MVIEFGKVANLCRYETGQPDEGDSDHTDGSGSLTCPP